MLVDKYIACVLGGLAALPCQEPAAKQLQVPNSRGACVNRPIDTENSHKHLLKEREREKRKEGQRQRHVCTPERENRKRERVFR